MDISDNGFDRLPYSQMQAVWGYFPPTAKLIITGSENFKVRNDGALVPYPKPPRRVFFDKPQRFHHQAEFVKWLILMQDLGKNRLNFAVAFHILSFILHSSDDEMKRLKRPFFNTLVSSLPPVEITLEHENESLAAVNLRIMNLQSTETCLDLSRCGLNRLVTKKSQHGFAAKLKTLPASINSINLHGNGFLRSSRCRKVFTDLMALIPRTITGLDLSANDFGHQPAEELAQLFLFLPITVQRVTFDHKQPIALRCTLLSAAGQKVISH